MSLEALYWLALIAGGVVLGEGLPRSLVRLSRALEAREEWPGELQDKEWREKMDHFNFRIGMVGPQRTDELVEEMKSYRESYALRKANPIAWASLQCYEMERKLNEAREELARW